MVNPSGDKDATRVAAGLKAAINNPNVSEEAKDRAADKLDNLGGHSTSTHTQSGADSNRVLGGYKATLANEHTSPEAKAHAREILEAHGYTIERAEGVSESEHETRVLAGYKAALNNSRVSAEAKAHAKEYLTAHNAI